MPTISIFLGIIIRIYYEDHNPPHFHAYYQDYKASFSIDSGEKIDGKFPKKQTKIIEKWANKNRKALLKNWELAKDGLPPFKIPGEKND